MPIDRVKTVNVDVPETAAERATVVWLKDTPRPPGKDVAVRRTSPENPFWPARVTRDTLDEPAGIVSEAGLADTVKSTTWTVTTAEWNTPKLIPVTVTL